MNQEGKKWPSTLRYWLGGLGILVLLSIAGMVVAGVCSLIFGITAVVPIMAQERDEPVPLWAWGIGFPVYIWLLTSPLICLYWVFKPAERFWWKHKYISHAIGYGSFFGCVVIIAAGIHFLLWFFPDSEIGLQARFFIAGAIGIIATFALWCKLSDCLEQKQQKHREKRIDWEFQKQKRSLLKGETTLAPFIEEVKKLENLEKKNKLSPFLEERLIALERVCDVLNVRWRQEGAPRVANIHKNYDDPTDPTPNAYGYTDTEEINQKTKQELSIEQIWEQFHKTHEDYFRNLLMEHYRDLVKDVAEHLHSKLPDKVEIDDLISAGIFGLIDAIEAFDPARGSQFETYCKPEIRAAILRELQYMDEIPQSVRIRASQLESEM